MLLALDTGNTNTTASIFQEKSPEPLYTFRFSTHDINNRDLIANEIMEVLKNREISIDNIIKAGHVSVVPSLNEEYSMAIKKVFNIDLYQINHQSNISFKVQYDNYRSLGLDRIVNIEAAICESHESFIIIDIGTAATFCTVIDKTFIGGMIAPGIGTTIKALASVAEHLPVIEFKKPSHLIAQNSVEAIESGFFYGWISLIEGLVSRISSETGLNLPVLLTGGLGALIHNELSFECIYDPHLTLRGIQYLYQKNNP